MLHEIAEVARDASVTVAALFAVYGLDAWRREFVGKRRMELAEEVLALFYQARDVLNAIRNPGGYVGEGQTRKPGPDERPEDKEALDSAFVLIERYNRHTELFSRIRALRYRFMAQLGPTAAQPFDDLDAVVNKMILASHELARLRTRRERTLRTEADAERHYAAIEKAEAVFWRGGADDPITQSINDTVASIERSCKGIIEGSGTLYGILNVPLNVRRLTRRCSRRAAGA